MKKNGLHVIAFVAIIVSCAYAFTYFENCRLDGFYEFDSQEDVKASLSISGNEYKICFHTCHQGRFRTFSDGVGGKYIQFQDAAMLEFGKAIGAPLDPDIDGKLTAVRLGGGRNFLGSIIAHEDPGIDKYEYFRRIPFRQADI